MGLFTFVKEAGQKLFGGGGDKEAAPQRDLDSVLADKRTGEQLTKMVGVTGLGAEDLRVKFREGTATVSGKVNSQADREKVVLLLGNTQGVGQVDDQLSVGGGAAGAPAGTAAGGTEQAGTFYTVKSGDSLSKIAKAHYGDAMKYSVIFEANKPMLKDPDKIYPGQVLRIPPKA